MAAHYFLGARLLGTGAFFRWDDAQISHRSEAFFCPECGEIWGRVLVEGAAWHAVQIPCERHGGGSFIFPWRRQFSEFPPAVLSYELAVLLRGTPDEQASHT